ncbi:MAG TPA: stage 0 sporulation family protein [Candidatus Omnitrophota bacterium]|nr:stage 0 sporulation family protein [Candidatus Omnitrophota bacterium]
MGKIVQIQLGEYRPVYFYELNDIECGRGDCVVLEVDRGSEFGKIISDTGLECKLKEDKVSGKVLRKATEGDIKQIENNRMKAKEALNICLRKINERKLDMRIVKAEYTFDSSKIIFSFISEGRVDFRNLVKDLARIFRVRIELRQIGVRDKAKIVGGYGVCGRELCCSSYLNAFHPLSIRMAKEQGLPLNPSRISGACGRIKCCMAYEFAVYKEHFRTLPRLGEKINTPEGRGRVVDINILKRLVSVDVGEGRIIKTVVPKDSQN